MKLRCANDAIADSYDYVVPVVLPKIGPEFLAFTFAVCYRPSVCLSSVVCLSVTLVRPTQAVEIFGNIFKALGTLAIH